MFLLILAAAVVGGTCLATLIEPKDTLTARLSLGAALGIAVQALVGFVLASWLGLTPWVAWAAGILVAAVPVLLMRQRLRAVWKPHGRPHWTRIAYGLAFVLLFWAFFGRAAYMKDGSLMTGEANNYGDLGVHVGIITGFVKGDNFPPEHTEMAGTRLTYPFLVDFGAALLVAAGGELTAALLAQNLVLALALLGMLHSWAVALTRDRGAGLLTPVLFFFSGGFGFVALLVELDEARTPLLRKLWDLPHSYTIVWGDWGEVLRWGNPLTTLLITQRAFLLGLPLALAVWTSWWRALEEDAKARVRGRRLLSAGLLAGLLPLVHAHSFIVLMAMGGCVAVMFANRWRDWLLFFGGAVVLALPQIAWSTSGAGAQAGRFVGWHDGWTLPRGGPFSLVEFWAINLGLSWLGLAALFWPRLLPSRLRRFLVPFLLCLVVPNVVKLAPWEWDNIKVLLYGYLALVPPLAVLLARLFRGGWGARVVGAAMVFLLALSGALDVWRVVCRTQELVHFGPDAIAQARMIEEKTPARARILTSLSVSRPTLLTGRRSVVGAPFHVWSHGMDAAAAEQDVRAMYAGGPEADERLRRYAVDFVLVGPLERAELGANEAYFARFEKVGEAAGASLYRVASQ